MACATVYWADGHYIREAVRDINWILRDHYSDEVRPMNAGVLDVLGMLRSSAGKQPIRSRSSAAIARRKPTIACTMRSDGVASNSYHIYGMAIDLRCEGRDISTGAPGRAEPAAAAASAIIRNRISSTSIAARSHLVRPYPVPVRPLRGDPEPASPSRATSPGRSSSHCR